MTRAVTGAVGRQRLGALVEARAAPRSCGVLARGGLRCRSPRRASWSRSLARVVEVALGRDGVADPAEQVADGLERAARALLDRGDDLEDAALHAVQRAAGGLAEVGGEEDQGAGDEQPEDCPSPANRLVVHVVRDSKAWSVTARRANAAGAGSSNSCSCGGSPRTPRASGPSRPPRRSAATRPGGTASASPRAGARRAPAAASRRPPA